MRSHSLLSLSQTMSSQASKPSKPSSAFLVPSPPRLSSSSPSSLSSHFAMIELKQSILTSLSKLSDRDTHHIALQNLHKIIQTLSSDAIPMLLNCLYDASNDSKPAVKKESLRLLSFLSSLHTHLTLPHLSKIITHIVRKLQDSDSGVRDSCRDAIGALSSQYLRANGDKGNIGSLLSLFAKPLFEAMGEQNKVVQAGSAMCMANMVESALDPPAAAFQKLCPRICKYLTSQNFLARSALLPVVASLSQVGAIAPQRLPTFLQIIRECLQNSDWGTRKAAAETLSSLASHSSHLIADDMSSTITALEACRFDKVKPVRDSMNEALQLWKKIADKGGNGVSEGWSALSHDGKVSKLEEKFHLKTANPGDRRLEPVKDAAITSTSTSDSLLKAKGSSMSDKTVGILKKKASALSDKEFNPEFFQKLASKGSDDLPVEVVVLRKCLSSSNSHGEDEPEANDMDYGGRSGCNGNNESDAVHGSASVEHHNNEREVNDIAQDKWTEERLLGGKDSKNKVFDVDDRGETNQRDSPSAFSGFHRIDSHVEGPFMNSRGNWLAIQRQLSQLERQQSHLLNMLQDFMGGSHDSMVTLENRVRGLERVIENMARDLAVSSGRRGSNFMMAFEGSSVRPLSKYNGLPDYSSAKLSRSSDGRVPFVERFPSSDSTRGRDPLWRSDMSGAWDSYPCGSSRNGHMNSRRAVGGVVSDVRSPRSEHDEDQVGYRRAWINKGPGSVRFGEGPSARSVWQASKDEATLEAIRVAGEDSGTSRVAKRVAIPELTREAMGDDNGGQERGPIWACWSNAMDALDVGDEDTAYAEVVSTGEWMKFYL